MPRNKRSKRVKSIHSDMPIIGEVARQHERNKALKALGVAKQLEQDRLANGYVWVGNSKTKKLVKQ